MPKLLWRNKKIFFTPEALGQFQPNKDNSILQKGIVFLLSESVLWNNHSVAQICLLIITVSRVSDVANLPLVSLQVISLSFDIFLA